MGARLKEWYEAYDDFINKKFINMFLNCMNVLNIKLPHYILVKILDLTIPPILIYDPMKEEDDPVNIFVKKYFDSPSMRIYNDKVIFTESEINLDCDVYNCYTITLYETFIRETGFNFRNVYDEDYDDITFTFDIDYIKPNKSFILKDHVFNYEITIYPSHPQYNQFKKLYDQLLKYHINDINDKMKNLKSCLNNYST